MSYGAAKDADALANQRRAAAQQSETAEDIVRALAEAQEPEDFEMSHCIFCDADLLKEVHAATCPWRRAREWVAQ